jgi:hypothetical protein
MTKSKTIEVSSSSSSADARVGPRLIRQRHSGVRARASLRGTLSPGRGGEGLATHNQPSDGASDHEQPGNECDRSGSPQERVTDKKDAKEKEKNPGDQDEEQDQGL